ncbi:MAG: EAL domain-containing protein [Acidimicrobiales bacterium]
MKHRADLHDAVRQAVDPMGLMQRVADEVTAVVAGAEGVLIGLVGEDASLSFVCGSGYLAGQVGGKVPLTGSLSGLAVKTRLTLRCDDAESDPRVHLDLCQAYRVASAVCVPLRRGTEAIGVLNVSSSRTHAFDDGDVTTLSKFAEFVSVVIAAAADLTGVTSRLLSLTPLDAPASDEFDLAVEERFVANVLSPGTVGGLEARRRIERVLEGQRLMHHFQPIFDLWSGELFAFEALARFPGKPKRPPDQWFAEAHAAGLGVELEIASMRTALESLSGLPPGIGLCLNAGPDALADEEVLGLLIESDPGRIVIELTEQVPVDDYPRLGDYLARLRLMGARLAIDDTGAGFASLAHILKLSPDLIKLDRALTTGIDCDPVRRALAAALVAFTEQTRAEIIAEGIETAGELAVLGELGIRYGQGYFLGRPKPLDSVRWRPAHPVRSRLFAEVSRSMSNAVPEALRAGELLTAGLKP